MHKKKSMKAVIVSYVTWITVSLGVILTIVVIAACLSSTVSVLKDNLQMTVKTSSQNISSNLHLLTDRLDSLAQDETLCSPQSTAAEKQAVIDARKQRIEFSWIAGYDALGSKIFGDEAAPDSVADTAYFEDLTRTDNITIGEPQKRDGKWEISLGTALSDGDGVYAYLVGTYNYGILNDVLSNITIGKSDSVCILNEEGVVIADKSGARMETRDNIYMLYTSSSNHEAFDTALSFQTGCKSVMLKGKQSYLAYAPIAGTNWTLLISAPGMDFMQIMFVSILICIAIILVLQFASRKFAVKLADNITLPISNAAGRLATLSAGDLQTEVPLSDANAETEILTSALIKTVESLAKYIEEIRSYLGLLSKGDYSKEASQDFDGDFIAIKEALTAISDSLNETMHKISSASEAVSSDSSETSMHAKKLYDGSREQTEALARLSRRIEEISEEINAIDANAHRVKQSADTAGEKVEQGKTQMDSMLNTMNSIHSDMQEIVTISSLIEEISSQTSLLALNASIEAARAGESGKGFAIVAQQIGILSEQTADALRQTGEIINQIKQSIANGLATANTTGQSFENVRLATEEFGEISDAMANIVVEQKEKILTVTEEVKRILQIADVNQGLAEKTDKIAEHSLKQAENLENIVSAVRLREDL